MGYFSESAAAVLAGRTIRCAILVFFNFLTTPKRAWLGDGDLYAGGFVWSGLGELGSIDGLDRPLGDTAPQATFRLSGVDGPVITETLAASTEVKGRDVTVYIQMFTDLLMPLDGPVAIYSGVMDVMRVTAAGATSRTIEVTAETLFTRRSMPAWGYLSDRDQNRLFPGDRGLEFVPSMAAKTVVWPPDFSSEEYDD